MSRSATIFDFDGVLADTETVHFRTFAAALSTEGIHLTWEENSHRFMGIDDRSCFRIAFEEAGRGELPAADADRLVALKSGLYAESLPDIELFPGSREAVLEALRRGPATIATCGARRDVEAVLARHGLLERFPAFVTADEIRSSKPDPECFLAALDVLRRQVPDLEPGDCVVFEDSFRGVEAARRAGMRCVALTHTFPRERLTGADRIIGSWSEWRWPGSPGRLTR